MKARALAGCLLLGGCTVGPNFHRPEAATAPAFAAQPADVASRAGAGAVDARWWTSFRDPLLSSLVDRLARQNLDLAAAAERITQARAQRQVVRAQALPRVDAQPMYQRQRLSRNGTASLVEPTPGAPLEYDLFRPEVAASWELDLFGRVRRAVEAADASTQAAVEARHGVALAGIAELAGDYCELRGYQAQEQVLLRNLAAAERRRELVRNRFANGVATTLEIAQADAQALSVSQDLPTLHQQQARLVNAIGLLLAEPPGSLRAELTRPAIQPLVPPAVPVGLPGELARRRPDVREAEARLHAATAMTGVAVASFYPSVSLNGNFGFESLHPSSLFDWASRIFTIGPTVDLPIFQGGRLTGTLRLREAEQREAAIRFRQVVLQAWHEVDDALTAYAEAQRRRADAVATGEANARALAAADQQYRAGVTTLLDVITAQEAVLRSQDAVAQAQAQMALRLVDLYRALGGGWDIADPGH